MIINTYIRHYIYRDFALSFLCLMGVVLLSGMIMAIRELGDWVSFSMSLRFVMGQAPELISITLPVSFFLGVTVAMNRLINNFQMVALFSLSFHRGHIMKTVLPLALVLSVMCAIISTVWKPVAQQNFTEKMISYQNNIIFKSVQDGVIGTQSIPVIGEMVISSSKDNQEQLRNSFFSIDQKEEDLFLSSSKTYQINESTDFKRLLMDDFDFFKIDNEHQLHVSAQHSEFRFHLPSKNLHHSVKHQSTFQLINRLGDKQAISELFKRTFPPLSILLLSFLAVVGFQIHPYSGKNKTGLLFGGIVLYYISYLIMERMMQTNVQGLMMMLIPHVILSFYILWMWRCEKKQ